MKSKMQKFKSVKKNVVKTQQTQKRHLKKIQEKRKKKKETDDPEIKALSARLWPEFGEKKEEIDPASITAFSDLPISKKTMNGLNGEKFTKPTDIQRESLLFALKGHDILGAAKTGSGKTLAFLIPILETLFRQRYTPSFGMAALVISPTRELAYQSFDVLKKIGKHHDLSFGLIIGGMPLKEEAKHMNTTNVVICTPGRLQQHFEQTPNFTADELKVLVLDEADKILHFGFAETMNAIVEALPRQRQTLLFSATQTKSVKDLARLSLKKPIYVSVHEKAKQTTPTSLDQRYIVCESQDKVNTLWSFIRSHKHKKVLVFLSCCKQVRYLHQVFRKMQPGLTLLGMHGHMKQHQRMEVYNVFTRKQHAVLLATDVAARGLDFPAVNWVVQLDRPENVDTYIHRVGRTARYERNGEALLVLLPSEEKKMVENLAKRKIPIGKLRVSKKRMFDVTKKLESLCASDKELKDNAQKAFISMMKSLYVLDKASFSSVDMDAFAVSLGLVQAPKLPFLEKAKKKKESKAASQGKAGSESDEEEEEEEDSSEDDDTDDDDDGDTDDEEEERSGEEEEEKKIKEGKLQMKSQKQSLNFQVDSDDDDDDEDKDIFKVVKDVKIPTNEDSDEASVPVPTVEVGVSNKKKSKAKERLKLLKYTKRITFDDDGNEEKDEEEDENQKGLDIPRALERMREQDRLDKEAHRQRVKFQHREKRLKEKEKRRQAEWAKRGGQPEEEIEVTLGNPTDDDVGDSGQGAGSTDQSSGSEGDSEDEGPQRKRARLEEDVSSDAEGEENEEENSNDEEMDDESDEENDNDDSEDAVTGNQSGIEQDEAAVLALLGGKR